LLFHLDDWLVKLETGYILSTYKARMSSLGQPITVTARDGKTISGEAVDVLVDGGLVIKTTNNEHVTVYDGDVTVSGGS
ncbi:MAG: hypothetical protein AAF787_05320, partial [Chloroflexota bacterium]